jgi:imidazolonepropionase-like amidohydrolase
MRHPPNLIWVHLLAAATALAAAQSAAAQDFAIMQATIVLGDGSEPIDEGTLLVRNGRVVAAGEAFAPPEGVRIIDGRNMWVTPGLFLPLTDLGLYDVEAVEQSNDREGNRSVFNAALDVAPAINSASEHIAVARAAGITRASVAAQPIGSIFAGQGALIDLGADRDAVTAGRAFQLVYLGEEGAAIAGGSRLTAHAAFRNALREAQALAANPDRDDDTLLNRPDAAALIPVVEGRQKLYVAVERASDIRSTLALREEFPKLDLVIFGASEGWLVASEIAAAGVPVITPGLADLPSSFERLAATQSNVGRMQEAGVKVALGGFTGTNNFPRYARHYAGNLVALSFVPGATGLSWGKAFAAISSIPAEISGMGKPGDQAGVFKPGAHGDVVMWDGDPLELGSAAVRVFIDGVEQPLESHQTRLRERYRDASEATLPKAYSW